MGRSSVETRVRRAALATLALSLTAATGTGVAHWAIGDANDFYMRPVSAYGSAAYARRQPVADSFWQDQDGGGVAPDRGQAGDASTDTSAQPE